MTGADFWRYGLRALLAVSLLLNAAALGVVLRVGGIAQELGFEETSFPKEVRQTFRDAFQSDDGDPARAALKDVADARRALIAASEIRPFDEDAVKAAMAESRDKGAALVVAGQTLLMEALKKAAAD